MANPIFRRTYRAVVTKQHRPALITEADVAIASPEPEDAAALVLAYCDEAWSTGHPVECRDNGDGTYTHTLRLIPAGGA